MKTRSVRTRRADLREAAKASGAKPSRPLQAIRAKCLECSGGSRSEIAHCPVRNCSLWPFRFGIDPWRKPATEAQRLASMLNARRNLQ